MTIRDIALSIISNNPSFANNPRAQEYISIIKNNDSKRGNEIAQNLCATYGMPVDQAVGQAKQFFGISV